jgi:Beta-lactamase enzyme family
MFKSLENKGKFLKSRAGLVFCFAAVFVLGVLIASVFWYYHANDIIKNIADQVKPSRQNSGKYSYINPLLGYDLPGNIKEFDEYNDLVKQVDSAEAKANNANVDGFSFYFRDLTLGRWAGENENVSYFPGSMMKVAVMITYFKEAEQDPDILQKTLVYSTSTVDQINGVPFSSPSNLQVGKSYPVEKLIEAMIINSDNGAKDVLLDSINQQSFVEVHTDLGLPNPAVVQNYTITAKQYAVLLRVLYGATYLGRQYSEKALQIMSQATYNQGLVAGVPKGTAVSQKFGEALDSSNPTSPEINLSDCGIIYHPTHPYILCVMTKGKDINALTQTISSISNVVWNQVVSYADGK